MFIRLNLLHGGGNILILVYRFIQGFQDPRSISQGFHNHPVEFPELRELEFQEPGIQSVEHGDQSLQLSIRGFCPFKYSFKGLTYFRRRVK